MATIANETSGTGTQTNKLETKYQEGIFNGRKYASQEEAVEAGAYSYAVQDKAKATDLLTRLGLADKVKDLDLIQALYDGKKEMIMNSIEKRVEKEIIPEGLKR